MAVNTRNSIVTNGLVFCLDAANLISFDSRNLLINTENFTISWTNVPFNAIIQRTGSAAIAPDGTLSATEVYKESGTGLRQTSPFGFINVGDTMTFSVYAQAKSGSSSITLDIGDEGVKTLFINDTEWTRCSTTVTYRGSFIPNGTNFVDITLPLTQSIYLWGAQWNFGQLIDYVPVGATIPPFKNLVDRTITSSLVNGPVYKNYNGGAIRFDGSNDYVITATGSTPQLDITSSITLETWLMSTALANISHGDGVNSKGLSSDNNSGVYETVIVQSSGVNYPYFRMRIGSTTPVYFPTNIPINLNQIYHFVSTYDGNVMRIYINGIQSGNGLAQTGSIQANTQQLAMGVRYLQRGGGSDSFFSGSIYINRIYNRALSQQEVLQNYNTLKSRFNLL